jgi:AraC family transcriptional regulator
MMRVRGLFESALVKVERIDHPAGEPHVDPPCEVSQQYSINFLEHGEFCVEHASRTWRIGATEVFVTVPGQVLRYVHDDEAPNDVCIAVCFKDAVRDDIQREIESLRRHTPVLPLSNRRAYLRHRLFAHLTRGADAVAVDLVAGELLAATLPDGSRKLYRPGQLAWYARRIDAARRRLDEDFASDHTLAALACDAGMSPFHFARIFRELAGAPPHRYLLTRRLSVAAEQLRDGASVTDTCYGVGFRSLSHFIHVFRRAFGVSPSRIGHRRTR